MTSQLTDDEILAYLEGRPDLLSLILKANAAQRNATDMGIFDATGKIAANARAEARRLSQANQSLLDAAATNMLHWQALHHATLGFLACNDLVSFAQMIDEELPLIFGLAGARLLMPEEAALNEAEELGFLVLPLVTNSDYITCRIYLYGTSSYVGSVLISCCQHGCDCPA